MRINSCRLTLPPPPDRARCLYVQAISAGVAAVAALLNVPTSAIVSNRALVSSVIRYHVVPSSKLSSRGLHPFQQASTALAGAQLTITK